ncbi:hypothetical protein BH09SUM1_BH09SUM1_00300 [soil metagenome]
MFVLPKLKFFRRAAITVLVCGAGYYTEPQAGPPATAAASPAPPSAVGVKSDDSATTKTMTKTDAKPLVSKDGLISYDLLEKTKVTGDPPPVFDPALVALDDKVIRIVGFMTPYSSLEDMKEFMLTRTTVGCYYCEPPPPQEVVFVRQKKSDAKLPYVDGPIEIKGKLKLWKQDSKDEAYQVFLYVIEDATVKPAK